MNTPCRSLLAQLHKDIDRSCRQWEWSNISYQHVTTCHYFAAGCTSRTKDYHTIFITAWICLIERETKAIPSAASLIHKPSCCRLLSLHLISSTSVIVDSHQRSEISNSIENWRKCCTMLMLLLTSFSNSTIFEKFLLSRLIFFIPYYINRSSCFKINFSWKTKYYVW